MKRKRTVAISMTVEEFNTIFVAMQVADMEYMAEVAAHRKLETLDLTLNAENGMDRLCMKMEDILKKL